MKNAPKEEETQEESEEEESKTEDEYSSSSSNEAEEPKPSKAKEPKDPEEPKGEEGQKDQDELILCEDSKYLLLGEEGLWKVIKESAMLESVGGRVQGTPPRRVRIGHHKLEE